MRPIPNVPVSTEFFAFQGGLDVESPALRVTPGSLLACLNYEPDTLGGYRRPAGYERFDGRAKPSDAIYDLVAATLTTTPAVGAVLTIGAVTCRFVQAVQGGIVVTARSGVVPGSTPITITGPVTVGTTAANPVLSLSIGGAMDSALLAAAADVYRADIGVVPGSGPIRGVVQYRGNVYAFRNNAGNTAAAMYRASATGWTLVAFGEVVNFTNANASVVDGVVLTQGGVTATISRVVLETGALGAANTGRLFITGRAGGSFSAAAATTAGGGTLTLGGVQTAVTLPPGGRYEFDQAAFTGRAETLRLYGANGVGPAFEFDGTTLVTIDTKGTPNTPKFIKAHRNYLYLAQGASAINSSVGKPYRFVAAEGSAEQAVGDDISGFSVLPGEALGIFSRNKSQALTGASPTTWSLQAIGADLGAIPYTVQNLSDTLVLDDRGVIGFTSSRDYGNFNDATLSKKIQRLISTARPNVIASYVVRERNHYKLIMSDGTTLTLGYSNRKALGFTNGQLLFNPTCAHSGEDLNGKERVFIGGDNGFVYEMNVGSSFDGADIEAFIKVYYLSSKSPEVRKRYRRVTLEMSATRYAAISFNAEYAYGDPEVNIHMGGGNPDVGVIGSGSGSIWDFATWDDFFWDSQDVLRPSLSMSGSAVNCSLTFYSKSKIDFGHVLSGAVLHFTPRRLQRT